ncbi:hypothetical protein [Tellurirhabdus rosea]|uniref:hypothetical protein n=1 Tax=Tellurirhabdus rosea TaxID=2674997 RepID=UPI002258258D|nr:hypothetical protein [Tellurirhabdus rosea]
MSTKFNTSSLTEYSKTYARRLAGDFFANHTIISGAELLRLSPIGQVNLFVVSALYDKWKADAEKFRSPYFDFENPEVRHALQAFMNTVSQHISVRREHLEPLLAEAVKRTLTLLFDPHHYFDEALRNQPDFQFSAEAAKQLTRYTQINKFVPQVLEERMKGKEFIYVNHALNLLDEILTQRGRELEKPDKYIALFSEKAPLDPAILLRKVPYDPHTPQQPANPASRSFFELDLDTPAAPEAEARPTPTPALEPEPAPLTPPAPAAPVTNGSVHFIENGHAEEPSAPSFGAGPATGLETRHDFHVPSTVAESPEPPRTDAPPTIGEKFYRAPIESLSKSISLNQKFMFINQLFNGNAGSYNQAIEELDRASTYEQARDLISYRYAAQYMWDMSSDEVAALIEILRRRFAV